MFVAFDVEGVIREYEPTLWIYGHTHECDMQQIGNTRIVSNQLGYPMKQGGFECEGFDERKVEEVFGSLLERYGSQAEKFLILENKNKA